jgi:hypothetical protein
MRSSRTARQKSAYRFASSSWPYTLSRPMRTLRTNTVRTPSRAISGYSMRARAAPYGIEWFRALDVGIANFCASIDR